MPYSARENDADVIAFVKENKIKTVLDVGAGSGTYGRLLAPYVNTIEAVEIWQPYIERFNLRDIYDKVIERDVRELRQRNFGFYDLVVFGDVLEHMSRDESLVLWEAASVADYGLISVPIIHYPQGEEEGNPYEVHVQEHMEPDNIRRDYGPFVFEREYEVTGTFIKKF